MADEYIQIGVTALRAPDGSFLPSVPLYIKATPEARAAEKAFHLDIGKLFAPRMKAYMDQSREAEAATKCRR